jgi:stress response protein YsnF
MIYEKVVAVFDTSEHAQTAVNALKAAGFSADDISVMSNDTLDDQGAKIATATGFWHRLFGGDVDLHEAKVYGNTVGKGGSVVSLRAPETMVKKAVDILHTHSPVDVNQRAASLGIIAAAVAPAAGAVSQGIAKTAATASAATQAASKAAAPAARTVKDNEVISLAEEALEVGKRQLETGMTRVRRFVIEKAVEANVTLHEEHASIARRAITDKNYIQNVDWSDRTVEVRETAEAPVVSKTSRIVEEVVVGKEGSDRVETVKDKVRRQQVEVEKQPSSTPPRGNT